MADATWLNFDETFRGSHLDFRRLKDRASNDIKDFFTKTSLIKY